MTSKCVAIEVTLSPSPTRAVTRACRKRALARVRWSTMPPISTRARGRPARPKASCSGTPATRSRRTRANSSRRSSSSWTFSSTAPETSSIASTTPSVCNRTPFVARRLEVGYLLTSEGATASTIAHILAAMGGCETKECAISRAGERPEGARFHVNDTPFGDRRVEHGRIP